MNLITRPYDYSTLTGADRMAVWLYNKPSRWFTTVLLQAGLGVWFVFTPAHTLEVIQIEYSAPMAILFQLYGAQLISRAVMEQYVRSRLELPWIYAFIVATLPFDIISTWACAYATLTDLMNPYVGWIWTILFLLSAVEHLYVTGRHHLEKKSLASGTSPA